MSVLTNVRSVLSDFQKDVLEEALAKKSGGLSLPMGSGKTLISLLLTLILRCDTDIKNPVLVVVSKTLIIEWVSEIKKFFGSNVRYNILHKEYIKDTSSWDIIQNGQMLDLVLTTPEFLTKIFTQLNIENLLVYYTRPVEFGPEIKNFRDVSDPFSNHPVGPGLLYSIKWSSLIVDEAHSYYNINSKRCLALISISSTYRWLLSGTLFDEPRVHKIMGYYLMLGTEEFPRNLPEFTKFVRDKKSNFKGTKITTVHRDINEDYRPETMNVNVEKIIISHTLSQEEAIVYKNTKHILNTMKKNLNKAKKQKNATDIKKFSGYVLAMITYLRQCVVCPLLPITKISLDIADLSKQSELSGIFKKSILDLNLYDWLNNDNSLCSSRIQSVISLINKHPGQRIVIFSCFRTVLDILSYYIGDYRQQFTVSPSAKIDSRNKCVDDFSKSPDGLLLITYTVGSNGLNLQCSDVVILIDFWWNSSKTDQAIARINRRGQSSNSVSIYYLTSNTGIEKAVLNMHQSKIDVSKELSSGHIESSIPKLSTDQIIKLVNEEDNINILNSVISS